MDRILGRKQYFSVLLFSINSVLWSKIWSSGFLLIRSSGFGLMYQFTFGNLVFNFYEFSIYSVVWSFLQSSGFLFIWPSGFGLRYQLEMVYSVGVLLSNFICKNFKNRSKNLLTRAILKNRLHLLQPILEQPPPKKPIE